MTDNPRLLYKEGEIEAQPTWFHSTLYRCQIEARWAMFFEHMDIAFAYEQEYFVLGDLPYLPDFWLPKQDCWVEVKGALPVEKARRKALRLAAHTNRNVYIFYGPIPEPNPQLRSWYTTSSMVFFPDGSEDDAYWWCVCPRCGSLGLQFEARAARLPCGCLGGMNSRFDEAHHYYSLRLLEAYVAASRARISRESLDGRDWLIDTS